FNEGAHTALITESNLLAAALVLEVDLDARVEERQFAQTAHQDVVMEQDIGEGFRRRLEGHFGAGGIGIPNHRERCLRHTVAIDLLVNLAVTPNGQFQLFGKRIDHRHTDTMQATGDFVRRVFAAELSARVQYGHDHFVCRYAFLVPVDG